MAARQPSRRPPIRQDFRPLVFWLGSAVTDSGGRVTTTVTLPESLTTFQDYGGRGKRGLAVRIWRTRDPRDARPAPALDEVTAGRRRSESKTVRRIVPCPQAPEVSPSSRSCRWRSCQARARLRAQDPEREPGRRIGSARRRRPDPHRLFGADGGVGERAARHRAALDSHHAGGDGSFYWSGTKTLIFSPDASAPLPYATRFTVRVDASAASVAGRALGTPYELTFTTPTVRLLSAEWYRRSGRFDEPGRHRAAVQPAGPAGGCRGARARRARAARVDRAGAAARRHASGWRQTDPAGLARFDDKVAAVRRVTSASDAIGVRAAGSWNERRFPPPTDPVVLETTTAPPPGGRLAITIDATMPSPGGPARRTRRTRRSCSSSPRSS